jgi:hypothetical protein
MENHRIRLRKGDVEIEIESSDRSYLDSKLSELVKQFVTLPSADSPPKKTRHKTPTKAKASGVQPAAEGEKAIIDIPGLLEHIKGKEEYDRVEKNIIDGRSILPKIIMCLHYATDFFDDPYLTTGQIQSITDQLGIKVAMANAANKIRDNQKFFTGKKVRKKGQAVPYKLNRQGEQEFQTYISSEAT